MEPLKTMKFTPTAGMNEMSYVVYICDKPHKTFSSYEDAKSWSLQAVSKSKRQLFHEMCNGNKIVYKILKDNRQDTAPIMVIHEDQQK
jgi:hypothetical protein